MNNKSKKLFNNTILFLIGSLGSKFIQFILVPIYTYTLTASEYGTTEIVLTFINFLLPIFSISIADGFLRFGLDKKYNCDEITAICLKINFIGSIISVMCIPLYRINYTLSQYMFYFIIILNLRIYRDDLSIRLKILDKNKLYAIDSIVYTLILCISNILLLVILKMKIEGYFISYIIANCFSIIFLLFFSEFHIQMLFRKNNKELAFKIFKYSLPMIVNGIAWWITNASDKFMIQYLVNDEAVGIYSISAKLPTLVSTFTGVFNQAWIISSVIEFDNDKEKKFYSGIFQKYICFLFLCTSILILFIKPFIKVYVSDSYTEAWKYAPILISSATMSGIASFMVGIYAASMKNKNVTITTIIGGITNIVLNYIFIKKIGIMGAAVSTFISWGIVAMLRMLDVKSFFDFNMNINKIIIYTILIIFESFIMVYINNLFSNFVCFIICCIFIILEKENVVYFINLMMNKIGGEIKNAKIKKNI